MYIQLNSQVICYERVGEGRPVILLHGNCEDHHIFDELIEVMQEEFTVYAMDLRGHGESATPKVYSYDLYAQDVINLMEALLIYKPIIIGYSDGAITAMKVAMTNSSDISQLVLCGANRSPKGLKHSVIHDIKKEYKKTKDPRLALMLEEPHFSDTDLAMIAVPTTVVAGAKDCVREGDTKAIAEGISGARLKILPGEDHSSYIVHTTKLYNYLRGEL